MPPPNPNIQQQGPDRLIVYPTGTYPTDQTNVQWAVDNISAGGTVLLKPADLQGQAKFFHFGDDTTGWGSVNVQRDAVILGEAMPAKALSFPNGKTPDAPLTPDRTVVYGGKRPFRCALENPLATRLTVRTIYFAYPSTSAVFVKKSSGLEVSDCVIYDLGSAIDAPGAVGIEATGRKVTSPELRGEFNVFGNVVKRSENIDYGIGDCGIALQLAAMRANIHDNKVSSFALAGIALDANAADAIVEHNDVVRCGYGTATLPQAGGIGVRRGPSSTMVSIRNNTITGGSVAAPPGSSLTSRNGITLWGASDVTVSDNIVAGTVASDGILVTTYAPTMQHSTHNTIKRNDLTTLVAGHAQECFDADCDDNRSTANDFGAVDLTGSAVAGVVVHSNFNELTNETFWGNYPGTAGSPHVPCVWLAEGTATNRVTALKCGDGPPAFDLCHQIQDDGAANDIPGYERCAHVALDDILQREKQHCLNDGGTWSDVTHSCALP